MDVFLFINWGLLALGLFGLLTSTVFLGLAVAGILRFRTQARAQRAVLAAESFLPKVSLLKPLHGAEPGLEQHLRGFFEQDYPQYELLFCARTEADAGLQIACRLAAEYPHITTKIVTSGEPWAANAKACSLVKMADAAAHDIWIISDSDVRVEPEYLRAVVSPFREPKVGAVTCLYRGVAAEGGIWSMLEAVGMSIEMTSGVVIANMLEGMQFTLGPTMAVRRECVEKMGGFGTLGVYCADDFVLGNCVAAQGRTVVLSEHVIDHIVLNESFVDSIKHQVRWMKSTRFSRPKGHFGTCLTFATPFGLLACAGALLLGMPWLGVGALAFSVIGRMLQAWLVGRFVVQERTLWRTMLLFPVRDLMGFFFWAMSYSSRKILWRGEVYELLAEGVMRKV
ncbi:MAG: bacteriohopanetetrol glucosamine biosynthesis glycosyltransferase HpnI [Acidobacteriaceae bacterium]